MGGVYGERPRDIVTRGVRHSFVYSVIQLSFCYNLIKDIGGHEGYAGHKKAFRVHTAGRWLFYTPAVTISHTVPEPSVN